MATWGADSRYTSLVERHGASLLHLALLLTGNRHDAEDIVQDALISVAKAWPTAKPTSGLAYLKRAVANRAIDVSRGRRETAVGDIPETYGDDFSFLALEDDQRFLQLLSRLPERQRATLILRFHADMDDRAIAKVLNVTVATVRSQAQHGLAKLRADEELLEGRNSR